MIPLPHPAVPLTDNTGKATPVFQAFLDELGTPPTTTLFDGNGRATPDLTRFLAGVSAVVPRPDAQLVDDDGRPTRVLHAMMTELAR